MSNLYEHPGVDQDFLDKYRFDEEQFRHISDQIKTGGLSSSSSIFQGKIEPETSVTVIDWHNKEQTQLGIEAQNGKVALFVLNGGMATRFGNVVKGIVEVFDNKSFLELKAEDVRHCSEDLSAAIPFVMMNSFATKDATLAHFRDHNHFGLSQDDIYSYEQSISLRMNPDGNALYRW